MNHLTRFVRLAVVWLAGTLAAFAHADSIVVEIERVPADGLVVCRVDLTAALRLARIGPIAPAGVIGRLAPGADAVPLQFVPDPDFDATSHATGTIVARLPGASPTARILLEFGAAPTAPTGWDGTVETPSYGLTFDAAKQGGLPSRIEFPATGKVVETHHWQDRLHHKEKGSFLLAQDGEAKVERVATGLLCDVVRTRARFVQGQVWPESRPEAVHDWYLFRDRPLVRVVSTVRQREAFAWNEVHTVELDYPGEVFPQWAGGEPRSGGTFTNTRKSFSQPAWGVVHDGRNGVGLLGAGQVLLYDGGPGSYIQAHGDQAWQAWDGLEQARSAWLWLGTADDPAATVAGLAAQDRPDRPALALPLGVADRLTAAAVEAGKADAAARGSVRARVRAARQLAARGQIEAALDLLDGKPAANVHPVAAGDLVMTLESSGDGIRLLDLCDAASGRALVTTRPAPLFTLEVRNADSKHTTRLSGDSGWGVHEVSEGPEGRLTLRWARPADASLAGLEVRLVAGRDDAASALRWSLAVEPPPAPWALWHVTFPGVAVADLGSEGAVFYPQSAGIVKANPWREPFRYGGRYPGGWTTMPYLAAYDADARTGLYLGVHDPNGSTKELLVQSNPSQGELLLSFDHPVPDMGKPGTRFELPGQAVWQLLRGDWFDAAAIYRDWVRREARWYPKLEPGVGRADTPEWFRTNAVWALSGGTSKECVPGVQAFARFLDPPGAVHWYNWHEIPFDNDYPHYFPTKPGFAVGVRELQAGGVAVMPYINGRLWDTRDRGSEDAEFTSLARPAVSKDEKGESYVETYGSKEGDGSPVRLGVMCPTTALWQERVREIVLRLMNECGVQAVYIDQIAAAAPTLCFDPSHGHPLGGGHWWTEGYWQMLDRLRAAMPPGRAITAECNGEPYIRHFDGYLTWHWQDDGQVPAFAAVYGGSIAMFGRSYGGGPTRDLALRMKAGQQLVFGEQIGWINPGAVTGEPGGAFFRDVVRLRRQLTDFFAAGEMVRPPRLEGTIPTVRADWQWNGEHWVSTDAVLAGGWRHPASGRVALIAVNVDDQPHTFVLPYDLEACGLKGAAQKVVELSPTGPGGTSTTGPQFRREVTLAPHAAAAWVIAPE